MVTGLTDVTWNDALQEFLLHLEATRAKQTVRFYRVQLGQLVLWATENDVPFASFGKRHLDRYLVYRQEKGTAPTTLHSDAVCAKAFFRWCQKYDLIERSLLSEYQVRKAPKPFKYVPSSEDVAKLVQALRDYYDPDKNPPIKNVHPMKRAFHREKNRAIVIGLLDSACRIGELLALDMADLRLPDREVTFRVTKGREPRTVPVSASWCREVEAWVKVRDKVMRDVPPGSDPGTVFISETGGTVDYNDFCRAFRAVAKFAGLPKELTLHALRHYSLTAMARTENGGLAATQRIAGHKDPKTTAIYVHLSAGDLRDVHGRADVVGAILVPKREKRKRLI